MKALSQGGGEGEGALRNPGTLLVDPLLQIIIKLSETRNWWNLKALVSAGFCEVKTDEAKMPY